jgi:hypothetical protein
VDLHHNLFYSYRGQNADSADRDRQLENNLTKALINTLSLGGDAVWRPFLADVGLPAATHVGFLLQRRDLPSGSACKKRDRVLLGISKLKSDWVPGPGSHPACASVPDAWLFGDGFALLVESKLSGDFSPDQMSAHLACLGASTPPKFVKRTWGEIHSFFRALLPKMTDASSSLLVSQFVQFLEYSGMTEFTGFQPAHFNYFVMHDDDDARRWVREQMESFASQVQTSLQGFASFYEACDVGVLRLADSSCWAAFGPRSPEYRKVTHQTVSLRSDSLGVFVNTELRSATDRLKNVLTRSESEFREALQHLHGFDPFELVLQERIQRQASLYDYTPKMRLHSSMLVEATGDVAWRAFTQTANRLPLPYLRIERLVPATTLIELSECDRAVQHVEEILKHNHAVVSLLNRSQE